MTTSPPSFPNSWIETCVNIELSNQNFWCYEPKTYLESAFLLICTPFVMLGSTINRWTYNVIALYTKQELSLDDHINQFYTRIMKRSLRQVRYPIVQHLRDTLTAAPTQDVLPKIRQLENSSLPLHNTLALPLLQFEQKRRYNQHARDIHHSLQTSHASFVLYLLFLTDDAYALRDLLLYSESRLLSCILTKRSSQVYPEPLSPLFWALFLHSAQACALWNTFPDLANAWFTMLRDDVARYSWVPSPTQIRWGLWFSNLPSEVRALRSSDPDHRILAFYHDFHTVAMKVTKRPRIVCIYSPMQHKLLCTLHPKHAQVITHTGDDAIRIMLEMMNNALEAHALDNTLYLYVR